MDPRIFTHEEATVTLEETIKPALERLYRNLELLDRSEQESDILALIAETGASDSNPDRTSHVRAADRVELLQTDIRQDLEVIRSTGALFKDLRHGLIDFFSIIDDQLALLCWQRGEDQIRYWHTIEDGFKGRRPLRQRAQQGE